MLTPQDLEQVSFGRATFGGYDMESVDQFLEPLLEDFTTLHKENALLKSKMKVLVSKLEEYRDNETSMKDAIVNAQKTCDVMLEEAEAKCAEMLNEANAAAIESAKNADLMIAAEEARVEEARKTACAKIDELREQILSCVKALDRIKAANLPAPTADTGLFDFDQVEGKQAEADTMADEISATLQNLIGTAEEPVATAEPKPPVSDATEKFKDLKFGPNYDPTKG
ncbi:MAG: DivIVA domain-containing protein [Oscillospiraceae bacterium]|nr:DivIVA domain-containing protein [Oscillospiraceae bacterium]